VRDNALEATAGTLAQAVPTLTDSQTLEQALAVLVAHERTGLPVVTADRGRLVGWLTHRDVLAAYNNHLHRGVEQAERPAHAAVLQNPASSPAGRAAPASAVERSLTRLQGYRIVDLQLADDDRPTGLRVAEVRWPPSTLLIALRRHGAPLPATDETTLQRGDRLTLLVPAEHADEITDAVRRPTEPPDRPATEPAPGQGRAR
jgi:CIC family chloride channel protein